MQIPFLAADVFSTLVSAVINEANTIAIGLVVIAVMYIGYQFLFKAREEVHIGRVLVGACLLLGAASIVAKYLPSAGS